MRKMYSFLCFCCLWGATELSAQDIIEPHFPGCEDVSEYVEDILDCADMKMLQFMFSNLKHPEVIREKNIRGIVEAKFTVTAKGEITNPEIITPLDGCGGACDEEVIRLINLMPTWVPGEEDGTPKDMEYTISIKFIP